MAVSTESKQDDGIPYVRFNNAAGVVVFIRHGESEWNKAGRFTGWVDVDLTDTGIAEAKQAAQTLKAKHFFFDAMYTSVLKRAIRTGNLVLQGLDQQYVPVTKTWRLNERMYGALQGLKKKDRIHPITKETFDDAQLQQWRRSFDIPPPPLACGAPFHPLDSNDPGRRKYANLLVKEVPDTECLKDVIARVDPYWQSEISQNIQGQTILVAAHGNSIRAIVKYLDNVPEDLIPKLEVPCGVPLVYQFDKDGNILTLPDYEDRLAAYKKDKSVGFPVKGQFLQDPEELKKAQAKVANQSKRK